MVSAVVPTARMKKNSSPTLPTPIHPTTSSPVTTTSFFLTPRTYSHSSPWRTTRRYVHEHETPHVHFTPP
jgi:hypothetical protein